MRRSFLAAASVLLLGSFFPAFTLFAVPDDKMPFAERWVHRLVRGTSNIAINWPEVFLRPIDERGKTQPWNAISTGLANTLVRAVAGAVDLGTFFMPEMDLNYFYPHSEMWPYVFRARSEPVARKKKDEKKVAEDRPSRRGRFWRRLLLKEKYEEKVLEKRPSLPRRVWGKLIFWK